jgi:hypothetical protein
MGEELQKGGADVLQATRCALLIPTTTVAFGQYWPEMDLCSSQDDGSKLTNSIIQRHNTEPVLVPIILA